MKHTIKYCLRTAYENDIRQHPQLDVESLGMKIIKFQGIVLYDCVIMEVENLPDSLPSHIDLMEK